MRIKQVSSTDGCLAAEWDAEVVLMEGDGAAEIESATPNQAMLDAIASVRSLQAGMQSASGEDTLRLIRDARSGALYGDESTQ